MSTSKDKFWLDEKGVKIPFSRISQHEKKAEKHANRLFKRASSINTSMIDYKEDLIKTCSELRDSFMRERKIEDSGKGNWTWFNFDRSIKIEISVNERIEFDDLLISGCRSKLNEFLDKNIESKFDFVKVIVTDAFSTSRGKLDTKKVMGLLKYKSTVSDPLFSEALTLLEESVRRTDSKTYFRISYRLGDGSYQAVELNFSNI